MDKRNRKVMIISTVLCIIPIIWGLILYNRLPDQIAIHFDHTGAPDRYASKAMAVFGLPIMMAVFNLYAHVRYNQDPKVERASSALKRMGKWLIPVLSIVLIPVTLHMALGVTVPLVQMGSFVVGGLIVVWGNYLPKCRRNYTLGYKLPWTLDDDDNWNTTHRMAGILWIAGGLLMMINALLSSWIVQLSILAALIVIPVIISYVLYTIGKRKVG